MIVQFIVPGIPIAQPRARATAIGGHARMYESKSHPVAAFKAACRLAARAAYDGPPFDCPLVVDIDFVFPRSKSQIWKKQSMPRMWHTKKPDRDNCDKAVLDALNGILWIDDCQICRGTIAKYIAAGNEQPHALVRMETVS